MKFSVERVGEHIATYKDWKDINGRGEIAHFIAELEVLRTELVTLWANYDEIDETQTKL